METKECDLAVHVLIDRSGSMGSFRPQTVKGFNEYIKGLLCASNPASVSLAFYNDGYREQFALLPAYEVPVLKIDDFYPCGGTATFQAIRKAVEALKAVKAKQRAVIVLTDGTTGDLHSEPQTKKIVQECQANGWLFIYLGANQAADAEAARIGIPKANALTFNQKNTAEAMLKAAMATLKYQSSGKAMKAKL